FDVLGRASDWRVVHCQGAVRHERGASGEPMVKRSEEPEAQAVNAATLGETVAADLGAGGVLSRSLPGYEERPAQIQMARAVAAALAGGEHLLVEASTGTGKSLAYLLPIIRSGKVALISTANKNLQEQLYYKDIPFVQRHVHPFKAALVKGMG